MAGYDLAFSPVKSVSALWAVAGATLAGEIRAAHEEAVADALAFIERRVLHTRQGHKGARQVNTRGLLAATFVHRDSRAGDPDLHTHVAIANKVQAPDGAWLAIDGRTLYQAKVTISEIYTTALQARLQRLGLGFVEVGHNGKRPVYEIAGVDPRLLTRWSSRRRDINERSAELVAQFEADHERPPTPAEKIDLQAQATLETRPAKHEPRSEAAQRSAWRAEAEQVLGAHGVRRLLGALRAAPSRVVPSVDERWLSWAAHAALERVESERASWNEWHMRSEALRLVRAARIPLELIDTCVDRIVGTALGQDHSVRIATSRRLPDEPDVLRRPDTTSVYQAAGSTRYTSQRILRAERRLVGTAGLAGGRVADANSVTLALLQALANGEPLNAGQRLLVHTMATSGRRLQLAIAPAGTGKTTAMRALATAWTTSGGSILGLAPSAAAAEQLRLQLAPAAHGRDCAADNLAKLAWAINHRDPLADLIGPDTLVIIDEAGMADTLTLDHVVSWCVERGASVRLVGDNQQLGAIGAGGVLRDTAAEHGELRLDEVVRFASPAEAAASLALRAGDTGALGFYLDHDRVHVADATIAPARQFYAWLADTRAGRDALMLAPTHALVAQLNAAARCARLAGQGPGAEAALADGNRASAGDTVLTRRNDRTLTTGDTAWVRNGDRWRVLQVRRDGGLGAC